METETPNDKGSEWRCATNWTIAHGSLDTSVTLESSESPIDFEAVDRKSPLILKPPSPESGPCEIKICFNQKHEVRQIYVRSTARVYEIYYALSLQKSNEYLCSVRCSIADEEAACAPLEGSTGELDEDKFKDKGNIGINEEDWVEVKIPDSPLLVSRISSLSKKGDAITGRSIQDLYEATVEISDADPCISITLRLLSLQNKGCICVDEVYVFADPVEPADSENQPVQVGNSAGSSLMAMLVPTFLQLSKSGTSRVQETHASDTMGKHKYLETGSKVTDSTDNANEIHMEKKTSIADKQDVKLQGVKGPTAESPQYQIPIQVSYKDKKDDSVVKNDTPYGQVETILQQLVSRVSRIEDICLRFEENMLKPINSMETRLERVEQQLEVLAKKDLPSDKFLSNEFNSGYNDGTAYPPFEASKSEKKDLTSDKFSNAIDDKSTSVSSPQLLPSLTVTAPEFSCGDDVEDDDVLEPSNNAPQRKPKSIGDFLAASLAEFSSTTTVQPSEHVKTLTVRAPEITSNEDGDDEPSKYGKTFPVTVSEENISDKPAKYTQTLIVTAPQFTSEENGSAELTKYTQTLTVTAPEFIIEENGIDVKVASTNTENKHPVVPSGSCETDRDKSVCDSFLTSDDTSSAKCAAQETRVFNDGGYRFYEEGTGGSSVGNSTDCPPAQDTLKIDDCRITEETRREDGVSNVSVSKQIDVLKQFHRLLMERSSDATREEAASSSGETDISKSSYSRLDFEIPILDVKFAFLENYNVRSPLEALLTPLEALLTDVAKTEALSVKESNDGDGIDNQSDLIFMEDGVSMGSRTKNDLVENLDCSDVTEMPSNMENGKQDSHTCSSQEMLGSLI